MQQHIEAGEHAPLMDHENLAPEIRLAIPTPEHYLPLLYILGAQQPGEPAQLVSDRCTLGSIAMTSVAVGS